MTTRLTILVAAALLLTACQTMTPEERRIADGNTCASYGFRRGTDAFATCLQRIELDRRAELHVHVHFLHHLHVGHLHLLDAGFPAHHRPVRSHRHVIVGGERSDARGIVRVERGHILVRKAADNRLVLGSTLHRHLRRACAPACRAAQDHGESDQNQQISSLHVVSSVAQLS